MPHGKKCPHCGKKAWDWFLEWYLQPERSAIFKGQAAMDCPWCRGPVLYQNDDISPAPPDLPVHRRDLEQATRYARIKNYATLVDFRSRSQGGIAGIRRL